MAILTMKKLTYRLLALVFCMPLLAHAVWFKGSGSAEIKDGNVDKARHQAVQNALLGLMYKGGASIHSVQVVKSGILESDKLTVKTNGEVHDLQVMKEQLTKDRITVMIRADIFPMRTCNQDNYSKTMLVGPIVIHKRSQAQLGGIYELGATLSDQFYQRLQSNNRRIDARQLMTDPIESLSYGYQRSQMLRVARSLSSQYDVQYIMFGTIDDLSSYNTSSTSEFTTATEVKKHRSFKLSMYVVDGIKGQIVFHKTYSTNKVWSFDFTMKIDPQSDIFWTSKYGKAISYILKRAIQDIQVSLYCKQTLADVVSIDGTNLVINLGSTNGVQVGDTFKLMRIRYLMSQDGSYSNPLFNRKESPEFKVVAVQPERAILQPKRFSDMANIQIRDILIANTQMNQSDMPATNY